MITRIRRLLLVAAVLPLLAGCLSTEVELSLAEAGGSLSIIYVIPAELWNMGTFDEASPERAFPVSERDARETAALYPDVQLSRYQLRSVNESIQVEMEYRAESDDSLSRLWGSLGTGWLVIDREAAQLTLPVGGGVGETDQEQADLLRDLFAGHSATFQFDLSAVVSGSDSAELLVLEGGSSSGSGEPASVQSGRNGTGSVRLPMERIVTTREPLAIRARWAQGAEP